MKRNDEESYSWQIGTRLAVEIKCKDADSAARSMTRLAEYVYNQCGKSRMETVRAHLIQALNIPIRAAYDVGASPQELSRINTGAIERLRTVKTLEQLVSVLTEAIENTVLLISDRNRYSARRIDTALRYMRDHCHEDVSRDELADVVGCSSSYLSSLFSSLTGRTFKATLMQFRIEKAKTLLERTNKTCAEIACELGYEDYSYFSTSFKKITGVTPGRYRKMMVHL